MPIITADPSNPGYGLIAHGAIVADPTNPGYGLIRDTVAGLSGYVYRSDEWAIEGTHSLEVPTGETATITLAASSTAVVVARNSGQTLTVGATPVTSVTADETLRATGVTTVTLGPGYWDTLIIVAGTYTGDYFDGNTLEVPRFAHGFWTGTPNASTSKQWGAP